MPLDPPPHFGGCAGPLTGTLCQPSLTPWFPLPQPSQPAFSARSWLHRTSPLQRHILVSLLLLRLRYISHMVFPGLPMAQTNTLSTALSSRILALFPTWLRRLRPRACPPRVLFHATSNRQAPLLSTPFLNGWEEVSLPA